MSESKLATFRVDAEYWQKFQEKARGEGATASALLVQFVKNYIDGNIDSGIDKTRHQDSNIEVLIQNAIAPFWAELTELKKFSAA